MFSPKSPSPVPTRIRQHIATALYIFSPRRKQMRASFLIRNISQGLTQGAAFWLGQFSGLAFVG